MNDIVPVEYVTILQAAELLKPSIFGGAPDRPAVLRVRQMGFVVSDGEATERAIAEIWKAVDSGAIQPFANGGKSRKPVKLSSEMTKIPMMRSASGRGFTFVRQSHPAFHQLATWFGRNLSNVTLLFKESEIRKLASTLRRARRGKLRSDGKIKEAGRPSRQLAVQAVIRDIVEAGKWN